MFDPEKSSAYLAALQDAEKHRNMTLNHYTTKPATRVLILRLVLEPFRLWQAEHTRLAKEQREDEGAIHDVDCFFRGAEIDLIKSIPFFAIISGVLERDCMDRVMVMLNCDALWEYVVRPEDKNLENQVYAFQGLLGLGASMAKMCGTRDREPQRTLRVDIIGGQEQKIKDEACQHMHTAWSAKHWKEHLDSECSAEQREEGKAKRIHIALESDATIDILESLHASVRRRIKTRGVQTHSIELDDINASWCIGRARTRDKSYAVLDGKDPVVTEDIDSDSDVETTAGRVATSCLRTKGAGADQRPGGGGLWRAFCRERTNFTKGFVCLIISLFYLSGIDMVGRVLKLPNPGVIV